jgi:hypothetical protein
MTTFRGAIAAAALAAVLTSCAHATRNTAAGSQQPTVVQIDNQNWNDVDVFVIRGLERQRLGMVNGVSKATLRIPDRLIFGVTPLRFVIRPIAGVRNAVSEEIPVSPGDEVQLTVPPR